MALGFIVAGALVAVSPAYADPTSPATTNVPDSGSRPVGATAEPGRTGIPTSLPPPPAYGPNGARIQALQTEVATIGERRKQAKDDFDRAAIAVAEATDALNKAADVLASFQQDAEQSIGRVYKQSAAVPDKLAPLANDLYQLGLLVPSLRDKPAVRDPNTARLFAAAQLAERDARSKYDTNLSAQRSARERWDTLTGQFNTKKGELDQLTAASKDEAARDEAARNAYNAGIGAGIDLSGSAGMSADPRALAAVRYALAQVGKPYAWGAEGPDYFDCSGLTWAAYRSTNFTLPRVANDQYNGTRANAVAVRGLLPGDLLFFSTDARDWRQIHHVAMYLGNGRMVHAPTFGETVKVAPVWWAEFFGATRVYGAVATPAPAPPGPPQPAPPPPPPTSPPPSASPSPTPSPSPSPSPSRSPTPSPTPSKTPSPTANPGGTTGPGTGGGSTTPSTGSSVKPSGSAAPNSAPAGTGTGGPSG